MNNFIAPSPPLGFFCLPNDVKRARNRRKDRIYRGFVIVFTFFIYASYHLSRKAISVVKNAWNCTTVTTHNWTQNATANCTDGPYGKVYLGTLDTCFLVAYAVTMFFISGQIGDRMNLRYFLLIGLLGSGIFTSALGLPYFWNYHGLWYFAVMQILAGAFQSTGWPSVVAVVANWFGLENRGLILGIWNAHTSVGNILGSLIAGAVVAHWGWSFIVPGLINCGMGILTALYLPSDPSEMNVSPPQHHELPSEEDSLIDQDSHQTTETTVPVSNAPPKAVGLCRALRIPGVIEYAASLFFAKLVAYTFLYWLPFYIHNTLKINGQYISEEKAAYYSTFYDVGGIVGSIFIGYLSDVLKVRGIATVLMTYSSIPALFIYNRYGGLSEGATIGLSFMCGFFVNGPYALITTAVSADLGTHKTLRGNDKAKATVTAIIDGTGTSGAAVGPFLTGWIAGTGWKNVFYMLITACAISGLLLTRIVIQDIRYLMKRRTRK
ncbi:glucose-6-phosphate exchanger SLC37A2-like isoform X2 [Oscarella lobularis]|uniref:glucose-6-phosphate exchanger SLC37A2-like isoform X2 n=1 Tax=Oscarella lobularis TaxID=121494 RepID=UPI003313D100